MTRVRQCAALVALLAAPLGLSAAAEAAEKPGLRPSTLQNRAATLVLGRVSMEPQADFPRLEKMVGELARRLAPAGIAAGDVLIAKNNKELADHLRDGSIDLVSRTPFSALLLAETVGAEILLREWKGGSDRYRTVFFARRDGGIASLADLKGRKIAFEDRGSTSAYLLPLGVLRQAGIDAAELESPRSAAPQGKVGYVFAASELNIAAWVARGLVDAGAFSDQDWQNLTKVPSPVKQELVVFHQSRPLIRSFMLARRDLPPALKERVKAALLSMHEDAEGREALKAFYKVERYDEIEGEALEALEEARRLFALIRNHVAHE
jgi:phosphonate transport system substrate-binding protein